MEYTLTEEKEGKECALHSSDEQQQYVFDTFLTLSVLHLFSPKLHQAKSTTFLAIPSCPSSFVVRQA